MWELKRLYEMQEVSKNNRYISWNEKEALKNWAIVCGSTAMNEYLFNFVIDEMRLQDQSQVG
ncbi:MAG: hypothetical protein N2235_00050 [Fischerella sp.]|nr:hypothetical protein [Fischerella sp.]